MNKYNYFAYVCITDRFRNTKLYAKFKNREKEIAEENNGQSNVRLLFHGSPHLQV